MKTGGRVCGTEAKIPTINIASMDIKTGFAVARPKHIVKHLEHPRVDYSNPFLREMGCLQGRATFETMKARSILRCMQQGRRRSACVVTHFSETRLMERGDGLEMEANEDPS